MVMDDLVDGGVGDGDERGTEGGRGGGEVRGERL